MRPTALDTVWLHRKCRDIFLKLKCSIWAKHAETNVSWNSAAQMQLKLRKIWLASYEPPSKLIFGLNVRWRIDKSKNRQTCAQIQWISAAFELWVSVRIFWRCNQNISCIAPRQDLCWNSQAQMQLNLSCIWTSEFEREFCQDCKAEARKLNCIF